MPSEHTQRALTQLSACRPRRSGSCPHRPRAPSGTRSPALPQPPCHAAYGAEASSHALHSWPGCACCLLTGKLTQALPTLAPGTPGSLVLHVASPVMPDLRGNVPKAFMLIPQRLMCLPLYILQWGGTQKSLTTQILCSFTHLTMLGIRHGTHRVHDTRFKSPAILSQMAQ